MKDEKTMDLNPIRLIEGDGIGVSMGEMGMLDGWDG